MLPWNEPPSASSQSAGHMIKYIGSKRRLVPVLGELLTYLKVETALDLFTGTTRVAQEFKRRGAHVTANDVATYSEVLAQCYIETDARDVEQSELLSALQYLQDLTPKPGYFTETFCKEARFFQPKNGARIDAIRDAIESDFAIHKLRPLLLCSLMEAADRVDSTTGVQMAYVKKWAPRSFNDLELRPPKLLDGTGAAVRGDARETAAELAEVDLAYLDPPYNQHRYYTNYHIWETLIRWDNPESYGVAQKRIDCRDDATKSDFNKKRVIHSALDETIRAVRAKTVVLSYNNESWISLDELKEMLSAHGEVQSLAFDSKRYVGAQIGIHNPNGEKVGQVSHLRNLEYVLLASKEQDAREAARYLGGAQPDAPRQPLLF